MANITFTMSNPAAKKGGSNTTSSFLYRGVDNRLNFTFTNDGLGDISFKNGNTITIDIPKDVLMSASKEQLCLNKMWMLQNDPATTGSSGFFSFVLTPKVGRTFNFANNSSITISFEKLAGGVSNNDTVECNYNVGGEVPAGPGQKLFVFNKSVAGEKPLTSDILRPSIFINDQQEEINNGKVYISPMQGEELSPPIANQLHLDLTYSGDQLVDAWPIADPPVFTFTFSYANINRAEALTNAMKSNDQQDAPITSAWNINKQNEDQKVTVDQNNLWVAQKLNNSSVTPSWEVKPTAGNKFLFDANNQKLDVHFQHIITTLIGESATAVIQWSKVPGYFDGQFEIDLLKQQPSPKIISFTSAITAFNPDQAVLLEWLTFGATEVRFSWALSAYNPFRPEEGCLLPAYPKTDAPALTYQGSNDNGGEAIVPPFMARNVTYICRLELPGVDLSEHSLTVVLNADKAPVIEQFTVDIQENPEGAKVLVSWLVSSDNVNLYCELSGVDGRLPLQGENGEACTREFVINTENPLADKYTLRVIGFLPEVAATRTLNLKKVKDVKVGQKPLSVAVSPDGNTVWVANSDSTFVSYFSAVNLPDVAAGKVEIGSRVMGVTLHPNGQKVYVAVDGGKLAFFSAATPPAKIGANQIRTLGVAFAQGLAVSENGQWLYYINIIKRTLEYLPTDKLMNPPPQVVGLKPQGIEIIQSPNTPQLLVYSSDRLTAFSGNDPDHPNPQRVDSNNAYGLMATNNLGEQVWILDSNKTNNWVRFSPGSKQFNSMPSELGQFWDFVFTPNGLRMFVGYSTGDVVSVYDLVYS